MNRYLMWLCLFFVIGVLALCPIADTIVVYISVTLAVAFLFVCLFKRKVVFSLLLCVAFVAGGCVMQTNSAKDHAYSKWNDGKRIVQGKVVDSFLNGEYSISIVETTSVDYTKVNSRLKLYIRGGAMFEYGDEIYVVGNLSVPQKPSTKAEVDYRAYNFSRGIYANCFATPWAVRIIGKDDSFSIEKLGMYSRRAIKKNINKLYPTEEAGVLTALMLGDKSGVSDEFKDIGSKVGIYHTMATSGLHVSILLTAFGLAINKLNKRKLVAFVNIILLVLIYVVIGYSPSISRAVIMNILMSISQLTDSKTDSYTSLALSATIILIFSPYSLFDIGFLLSFGSTLGILVIHQKISKGVKTKWISTLMMSLAALLGTGALTALYFGRITLLGITSNIFIVPLAEIILPLGYISVIISMICFPLGDFISYSVYPLVKLFVYIAEVFAGVPFASTEVPKPPAYIAFLITLGIFALFAFVPIKGDLHESRTVKKESAKQSN